jgi:hypothetical protein
LIFDRLKLLYQPQLVPSSLMKRRMMIAFLGGLLASLLVTLSIPIVPLISANAQSTTVDCGSG